MTDPTTTEPVLERIAKKAVKVRKIGEHEYGLTLESARSILREVAEAEADAIAMVEGEEEA